MAGGEREVCWGRCVGRGGSGETREGVQRSGREGVAGRVSGCERVEGGAVRGEGEGEGQP